MQSNKCYEIFEVICQQIFKSGSWLIAYIGRAVVLKSWSSTRLRQYLQLETNKN